MIAWLGNIFLLTAILFSLLQSVAPIYGYYRKNIYMMATARASCYAQTSMVVASYVLLIYAFLSNDFSISYVANYSHMTLPLQYKWAAAWGGHEGSLLLWTLSVGLWTVLYSSRAISTIQPPTFSLSIAILGIISLTFLSFIFLNANPFQLSTALTEGKDLNPLLQDPAFLFHPPFIFVAYGGFSIPFSITLSALITNKLDKTWASITQNFTLLAWSFLTLAILLGSMWAYHVLGWGGYWFWDPVENISLLPWLTSIALIHCLKNCERYDRYKKWASLLAIIVFCLSLIGTLFIRSGILMSVHTFANDTSSLILLFILLSIIFIFSFYIYAIRSSIIISKKIEIKDNEKKNSYFLLMNSILFFIIMMIILLAVLYPSIIHTLNQEIVFVGAPYYNIVLLPFSLFIIFLIIANGFHKKNIAMRLSHTGFIIFILSILINAAFTESRDIRIHPGESTSIGPYQLFLTSINSFKNNQFRGISAEFDVLKGKYRLAYLYPEKRIYRVRGSITTKPAIYTNYFQDLYIALGEPLEKNDWSVRLYYKPFIQFIWLGGFLMMLGGLIAIIPKKSNLFYGSRE